MEQNKDEVLFQKYKEDCFPDYIEEQDAKKEADRRRKEECPWE